MENDKLYLQHIADATSAIEEYVKGLTREDFIKNRLVHDAVIRQFAIVGEAAKHLSPETRAKSSSVPWRNIAGMRDMIIHEYFGVDLNEVWRTVEKDIAPLKTSVHELLSKHQ